MRTTDAAKVLVARVARCVFAAHDLRPVFHVSPTTNTLRDYSVRATAAFGVSKPLVWLADARRTRSNSVKDVVEPTISSNATPPNTSKQDDLATNTTDTGSSSSVEAPAAAEHYSGSLVLWFDNTYPVSYRKRDIRWIFIGRVASGAQLRTLTTSPLLPHPTLLQQLLVERATREARTASNIQDSDGTSSIADTVASSASSAATNGDSRQLAIPPSIAHTIRIPNIKYIPNWKEGGIFAVVEYTFSTASGEKSFSGMAVNDDFDAEQANAQISLFIAQVARDRLRESSVRSYLNLGPVNCYPVLGQPWVDDMTGRIPSRKIKISYELAKHAPPEAKQAVVKLDTRTVYEQFRRFGKIIDITPSPPIPAAIASAKDAPLPYVIVEYQRVRSATTARNCMSGDSGVSVTIPASSPSDSDPAHPRPSRKSPPSVTSLEDAYSLPSSEELDKTKTTKPQSTATRGGLSDELYYQLIRRHNSKSTLAPPTKDDNNSKSKTEAPLNLRISYEETEPSFKLFDWISGHPRLSIPFFVASFAGITYSIFDPYRVFSITNRITGRFDFSGYYSSLLHNDLMSPSKFASGAGGGSGSGWTGGVRDWLMDIWSMIAVFFGFGSSTYQSRKEKKHASLEATKEQNKDDKALSDSPEAPTTKNKYEEKVSAVGAAFHTVEDKVNSLKVPAISGITGLFKRVFTNSETNEDSKATSGDDKDSTGKQDSQSVSDGWEEREAEVKKLISRLKQIPESVTLIAGPRGSGKTQLINDALRDFDFRLLIDLEDIANAQTDSHMVEKLATQVNYFPLFSSFVQISSLLDTAITATTGAKAGLSTSNDAQVKRIFELATRALENIVSDERARVEKLRQQTAVKYRSVNDVETSVSSTEEDDTRTVLTKDANSLETKTFNEGEIGSGSEHVATSVDDEQREQTSGTSSRKRDLASSRPESNEPNPEDIRSLVRYPVIVIRAFSPKDLATGGRSRGGSSDSGGPTGSRADWAMLQNYLVEWATMVTDLRVAHVIFMSDNPAAVKSISQFANKTIELVSLHDASKELAEKLLMNKLSAKATRKLVKQRTQKEGGSVDEAIQNARGISAAEASRCVEVLGGRLTDLNLLVSQVVATPGISYLDALGEIVSRATAEVRKIGSTGGAGLVSGKSGEIAWSPIQFWRVIQLITASTKHEVGYEKVMFDGLFAGNEGPILALERAGLITISYREGHPNMISPGRPIYVEAFKKLIKDNTFSARMGIETCKQVLKTEEGKVKELENEMLILQQFQFSPDNRVRRNTRERLVRLSQQLDAGEKRIMKLNDEMNNHKKVVS